MPNTAHETWINNKWRPAMGWTYMVICAFDFIIFPLLWMWIQQLQGTPITQWQPITMTGAAMFHVAMGAVVGVTAWQRSQEKLHNLNSDHPDRLYHDK